MLGDTEREAQVGKLGFARRALGDDFKLHVVDHRIVARLHQQPTGHGLHRQPNATRIGQSAGQQQTQILFRRDNLDRLVGGIGRDDYLGENLGNRLGRFGVERAVERDDAAEGGGLVAGQRLSVGDEQAATFRHAARIGVLDDHAGRGALGVELGHAFIGRVGVVDVVVRQLLSLHLPRRCDTEALAWAAIERRTLMRVLAITQGLDQFAAEGPVAGRIVAQRVGKPIRDRGVVSRRARVGLRRQLLPQFE